MLAILSNHRRCPPYVRRNQVRLANDLLARAAVCSCRRIRITSFHIWLCLPLTATFTVEQRLRGPLWQRAWWWWVVGGGEVALALALFSCTVACFDEWSVAPCYLLFDSAITISKFLRRCNSPIRRPGKEKKRICLQRKSYLSVLCGYTYLHEGRRVPHTRYLSKL